MSRRRVLTVRIESTVCCWVSGPGAAELALLVMGRRPVWSPIQRAYCVQESTARDVVAAATARHYDVDIVGPRAVTQDNHLVVTPPGDDTAADFEDAGLW